VSVQLLGASLPVRIESYVVDRFLGDRGSYADYDAYHATLGHDVLFRHERWPSPEAPPGATPFADRTETSHALDGLRRARRLQAELQHPRILPVVDFFTHSKEWFSVFARLPKARSLHDRITAIRRDERPPVTLAEFVAISEGVTDGLAAIHSAGFVHRTLGTDNILLDGLGLVRLADLGCATPAGAADAAAQAFRGFVRPGSVAPEQLRIEGAFSAATDTWALGVALFELRYGRHPFWPEMPTNVRDIRASILTGAPAFPDSDDDAERLLQPWLRRLLALAPQDRYSDALEAQRDLHAIAAEIELRQPVARAFVAMPFAAEFDAVWRAIRSACAACRVATTRVDQSYLRDSVWDEICDAIRASDFLIAVAGAATAGIPNPNVMLEIGYARALHKPVLLLTDAPESLPFDLRTQRALTYAAPAIGGGAFHRELVSFISGVVSRGLSHTGSGSG
jgi:hypothetical protein